MTPKLVANGLIYGGRSPERQSSCFPRLCVSGNRWICAFRAGFTKEQSRGQEVLITWSDDEGQHWTAPIAPFKPHLDGGKLGVFREAGISVGLDGELIVSLWWIDYSNPELPLFNWKTEGLLESKLFLSKSYDLGESWSTPVRVPTSPFHKSTAIDSHIILAGGKIAYPFEQYKNYDEEGDWTHYSALMISEDKGQTWQRSIVTAHDPEARLFYWDQRPCELANGEIYVTFDTFEKGTNRHLNIHARRSSNQLENWSELFDTVVPGQPGYPLELADGTISLVYNDRGENPGIKLRFSRDGGKTYPEETTFLVYSPQSPTHNLSKKLNLQDVMEEVNLKFVFGYPCQRLLPNGDILITYYAGYTADTTQIWWSRISL
jgi:hypothetical protein